MSRCFPFPPPGYERKHRPEDLALFKETKHKEYKEKKEKKDKDWKKDKKKKEKDGSEKHKKDRKEKHKDRKNKHRDKKRNKEDRGKDKDKSSISEESTVARRLEERNGEKLHLEGHNKYSNLDDEGKSLTIFHCQNGQKPSQSILPSQEIVEPRFMQEQDRQIEVEEKGGGSQFLQRANVGKSYQGEVTGTVLPKPSLEPVEDTNNDGFKSFYIKKLELPRLNGEFIGKVTVQNLTQVAKNEKEGIPRALKEQNDSRLEGKDKYKETWGNSRGEKHKDRDKRSHGKSKHKEKEKKGEKADANIKNVKSESIPDGKNDLARATFKSVNLLKDVAGTAINEGSIKKRKDMDTNGFLHENEIRPNKVHRPALHHSTENGRKLEASSKSSSGKHYVPNNLWLDHNGIKEAKKPTPSSVPPKTPHHDLGNVDEALKKHKMKDHSAEASKRPPHPDLKYLSQILTVPTVGDWSEDDDQEWLLSKKHPPRYPNLESVGLKEELQVWSEAVHIETADICALPYVIPY